MSLAIGLGIGIGSSGGLGGPPAYDPSTISNLALRLDGGAQAYADTAATQPSAAPAGRVRRVDQAVLGGSWLAASVNNSAFVVQGGFDFTPINSTGTALFQPVGTTVTSNSCTIAVAFESYQPEDMPQYNGLSIGSDGQVWGPWIFTGKLRSFYNSGTSWAPGGANIPLNQPCVAIYRYSATGITIDYLVNGVRQTQLALTATINSHAITLLSQYVASAGSFHGKIFQQLAYSRTLTDTETTALLAGLQTLCGPSGFPTNCPLIATSGDSISLGTGTNELSQGMFTIMMPNIWASSPAKLLLGGVGGQLISAAVTRYQTIQKPRYSPSRTKNIMLAQIGTNTLAATSNCASATLTAYLAHLDTMRADGWTVVAFTVLPRSDASILNSNWTADRATYNTGVRAATSHYDALADVAADATMGPDGSELNTTYYNTDKIHPKAAGYVLLEPTVRAAVLSLL